MKENKKEKANKSTGKMLGSIIFILVVVFMLIGGIFLKIRAVGDAVAETRFKEGKEAEATVLYDKIVDYDYVNDYPKTPEEVMDIYLKTVRMLYGDMIVSEELYSEILSKQRLLLDEEILSLTTEEKQMERLLISLDLLKQQGVFALSLEQKAPVYNEDDKRYCVVRVTQFNSSSTNSYRNFYLSQNNAEGKWKIINWEATDQEFNSIETE